MKIINATTGKIGNCVVGPKQYLHETIRLGEVALCLARDESKAIKPYVWIVGAIDMLIDYVSLARSKGELEENVANTLLTRLDDAKKNMPTTAIARLASIVGNITVDELKELADIAQVSISAPIEGVWEYTSSQPKWVAKVGNYAGTH